MQTTADFKTYLESHGFALHAAGDALYVEPRAELTADDVVRIKAEKAELLALLAAPKPKGKMPALLLDGSVRIGFDCDPLIQWWKPEGQSLAQTLADLDAPAATIRRYLGKSDKPLHTQMGVRDCKGAIVTLLEVDYCVECAWFYEQAHAVTQHAELVEALGF